MSTPGQSDGGYRPGAPNGGGPGTDGEQARHPDGLRSSSYVYSPYGSAYRPEPEGKPQAVARPGIMIFGLVLMMLSTLPFLLIGVALLVVPEDNSALQLVLGTVDPDNQLPADQRVLAVRLAGGLFTGLAALYVLFAALAFLGRNWARIAATVMTGCFTVILLLNVFALFAVGTMDTANLVVVVGILAAAIGGTVILYLRESSKYFAGRPGNGSAALDSHR